LTSDAASSSSTIFSEKQKLIKKNLYLYLTFYLLCFLGGILPS
jgi:hypothetical protein